MKTFEVYYFDNGIDYRIFDNFREAIVFFSSVYSGSECDCFNIVYSNGSISCSYNFTLDALDVISFFD